MFRCLGVMVPSVVVIHPMLLMNLNRKVTSLRFVALERSIGPGIAMSVDRCLSKVSGLRKK